MKPGIKPTQLSEEEALRKIAYFCDTQERAVQEVTKKLSSWNCTNESQQKIIQRLIDEDRLNEERFAAAYVRGKFRIKSWGRIKIKAHLYELALSPAIINEALRQIDEEEYIQRLKAILEKQIMLTKGESNLRMKKVAMHAISKGYESNLVFETLKSLTK